MEKHTFKTNIKCSGCVAKVTPFLNKVAGEGHWQVDTENLNKILTVDPEAKTSAADVKAAIKAAGYFAESI
jgi:copper chaperone